MLKYLWLSGLVIVLDQASKWIMSSLLSLHDTLAVMPFFNLTMAHNYGAAFSFLAGAGGWQRWFFIGLTTVISIALFIWLKKLSSYAKLEAISISLILGGAIGNVIDRIYFGYVVDFLDFYYGTAHFAAFNIADSAICVGAGLLILDSFVSKPEQEQKSA
ncbi:MAG: signal peptidase II [Methylophaga sp.]|nr:signal peptidase II [Methylophaga sp.]